MNFSAEQLKAFKAACEEYRKENASVDDVYFALTGEKLEAAEPVQRAWKPRRLFRRKP
jgi:hypothetical protein